MRCSWFDVLLWMIALALIVPLVLRFVEAIHKALEGAQALY